MPNQRINKGPWMHRFLIGLFTVFLTLLFFWLIGFVLRDIGTLRGPDYAETERQVLDQALVAERESLLKQIAQMKQAMNENRERQTILRDSTNNSQQTMNQLLEFQRLSLSKDVKPSAEEQQALADSQKIFLANQKRYQEINEQIASQAEQQRALEAKLRDLDAALEKQRERARADFQGLLNRHKLMIASLKLAVLIPLLLIVSFFFVKKRGGIYDPILYAAGAALLVQVGRVIHEYFPQRYFKYILILFALLVVLRILIYLLRMVAFPKKDWLLKQYREAYERFFCPVCSYPVRRGPLKYAFWTRRTIRKAAMPDGGGGEMAETPYTCPVCGTRVFEECEACHAVRPSLLPHCDKCGAEKAAV